jgi:hypothetical protein
MMDTYTDEYYKYIPRQVGKSERLSRAMEIEKIERKIDELRREILELRKKSQIPKEPENGLVYFQVRYLGGAGKLYTFMAVRGFGGKWSSTGSRGQFSAPNWWEFVKLVRSRCVESTFSEVAIGEEL